MRRRLASGRVRYGGAAAEQQYAAFAADYWYARQSLAATVAKSWFVAIEAGLQRAIAQDAVRSAEELLRIAEERLRVGIGNELAVAQARANVGTYRDAVRQIELSREQALRALELLVGRYPGAEIAVAEHLAPVPPPVPAGLPSQLLERRPDVVAAERRVAAAFNRVGEARAAQLPRISLTAGGSSVSSSLIELKDTSNPIWSFGGNLIAPLYQGGALRAQVEIRSAEQKQAVAEYARVGQRAFGEVEGAFAAESALRERGTISMPPSATARARWSSRRSSTASERSIFPRSSSANSRCIPHGHHVCACKANSSRSVSTSISRSAADSTRRQWGRWRRSDVSPRRRGSSRQARSR
jgi:outer membrane protein TolC